MGMRRERVPRIDVRHERSWNGRSIARHRRRINHPARRPVLKKILQEIEFHAPGDGGCPGAVQEIEYLCGPYRIQRYVADFLRKRTEVFGGFFEKDTAGSFSVDVGLDGAEEGHSPFSPKAATFRSDRVSNFA